MMGADFPLEKARWFGGGAGNNGAVIVRRQEIALRPTSKSPNQFQPREFGGIGFLRGFPPKPASVAFRTASVRPRAWSLR